MRISAMETQFLVRDSRERKREVTWFAAECMEKAERGLLRKRSCYLKSRVSRNNGVYVWWSDGNGVSGFESVRLGEGGAWWTVMGVAVGPFGKFSDFGWWSLYLGPNFEWLKSSLVGVCFRDVKIAFPFFLDFERFKSNC